MHEFGGEGGADKQNTINIEADCFLLHFSFVFHFAC
jgi:hypothetical protein